MTKIYYIGGFGETCQSTASIKLKNSIHTECVNINWADSLSDNIKKLISIISNEEDYILIGFSMGCLILIGSMVKLGYPASCKKIILCSMTPYYKGLMGEIDIEVTKALGVQLQNEVLNFDPIISGIGTNKKIILIYGENEPKLLIDRLLTFARLNSISSISKIPKAEHNIHDACYIENIFQIINRSA